MSFPFPGHLEKIIWGPQRNGQHPSKGAAFTCLMLGCGPLLLSLKSIGNMPLTSLTAGSGLWVSNLQQKKCHMQTNILLITYSACLQLFSCANSREKTALAFIFLYAFKLVINTLLGTGHRKLEGIYPLWLAWGGNTVSPCYQLQISNFSSSCQAPALWNTPADTELFLSCTKTLFNQSFQSIYLCKLHFFQDKPQCFQKLELSTAGKKKKKGFNFYFQNLHVPFSLTYPSLWHRHQNAAVNSHVCADRHIFIQWNLPLATKALQFLPV